MTSFSLIAKEFIMFDYYDTVPGVYRDYQDYFGELEREDNEWDSGQSHEWESHSSHFNWEVVVLRLIAQLEVAQDVQQIEAVMSKYDQIVIDIAWKRLSKDQKLTPSPLL
jgi:hypothetical protein